MPDGLHCRPARFSVDEHQFAGFARQRRGRKPDAPAKGMAGKAVSGLAGTTATNGVPQNASQRLGASPRDRGDTPLENLKQNKKAGVVNSEKLAATANPTRRTYLTDPPTEYRQPADTAAYGDLGETEASKERKRRKATAEPSGGWRRLVPWL
jgi:hypothetical protein